MIDFECPNCGHSLHAPDSAGGKRGRCNSCQQTFTVPNTVPAEAATWTVVDVPKTRFSFSSLPTGLKFGLPVLGCLLLYVLFMITTAEPQKPVPRIEFANHPVAEVHRTTFEPGEDIVLRTKGSGFVDVYPTSDDWNEAAKHAARNDEDGLELMASQGRILVNASGTPAKYLSSGLEAYEVRIKGGKHDGKSGWVLMENVTKVGTAAPVEPRPAEQVVAQPVATPPVPVAAQPTPAQPVGVTPAAGPQPPAVAVAKPNAGDLRSKWMNDTYKDRIVRSNGAGAWEEVDKNTGGVIWEEKETSRTNEYVEVYCPKRSYEIRMFDDRMELKKDGKWMWVANGRWDAAAIRPPVPASQPAAAPKSTSATAVFKRETPGTVGRYLEQEGLKARDYISVFGDQDYSASSDYKSIVGGSPPCNLAYYVEGDKTSIKKVYLTLNVNNQAGSKQGHSELATASERLAKKASGQSLPKEVREAIEAAKDGEWKGSDVIFKIIKSDFKGTLKGYSLTFQIE